MRNKIAQIIVLSLPLVTVVTAQPQPPDFPGMLGFTRKL